MAVTFFARLYSFLVPHRRLLFAITLALIVAGALGFRGVTLEENVAALLPDGRSEVATDFALLDQAPFARKVLISLEAHPATETAELLAAADALAADLAPPWFSRAAAGPSELAPERVIQWLLDSLPGLVDLKELNALAADLDRAGIEARLEEARELLLLPEGWGMKGLLRRDPLNLRQLGLGRLRHLNLVPQARLEGGRFLSGDGRQTLVIADTPVPVTDSAGGTALLADLDRALAGLPPGIEATVVSGHRYAAANAGAIRRDLAVTLGASTAALIALFAIFLRHWRALFPFLVPVSVVCLAATAVGLFYGRVSAMTLGFGAVLLGISVDFALHVYFALRRGGGNPAGIVGEVARPVLFGGITTISAFAVLLSSELPGQRQLAVFAISGLVLALLLSLMVLPHLVPPSPSASADCRPPSFAAARSRKWVIGVWAVTILVMLGPALQLRVDGDLRRLSLVPPELQAAEAHLQQTWGNLRGKALVFAEGDDFEEAAAANARLFAFAEKHQPGQAVTLAPLMPPAAVQKTNREAWKAFWSGTEGERIIADLLAAGNRLGFAPDAFAPFLESLQAPAPAIDPSALRRAGLEEVVDALVLPVAAGGWRLLSLVPDTPETVALFADHRGELPNVRLVSQTRFGQEVSRAIGRDFGRFLLFASVLVTAMVAILFRRLRLVLLALLPVATGLAVMFGIMGAAGIEFTLLNVMATVLVIGLAVDYGIFMVCRLTGDYEHATGRAVLVSGLTTLAGFGALVLARHPALYSIGITVLLGVGASIPAALLVIPAFAGRRS